MVLWCCLMDDVGSPLSWRKWSSIHFWSQQKREYRQTVEPMTTTKNPQTNKQKNMLYTTSAQVFRCMHSVDQCTSTQNNSSPATEAQTLECTDTADGVLGIYGEKTKCNLYKERSETKDSKQCWLCIWLFQVNLEEGSSS